jgi:predicted RecA/RadA family phage recombinase
MLSKYKSGATVTYTNAGSAISSGDLVQLGYLGMGVATKDIAATTGVGEVAKEFGAVYNLAKNTSDALTQNQKVWWDASAGEVINAVVSGAWFIGFAEVAAGASDTKGRVILAPFSEEGPRNLSTAATVVLTAADFMSGNVVLDVANTAAATITVPESTTIPEGSEITIYKSSADAEAITFAKTGSDRQAPGVSDPTPGGLLRFIMGTWSRVESQLDDSLFSSQLAEASETLTSYTHANGTVVNNVPYAEAVDSSRRDVVEGESEYREVLIHVKVSSLSTAPKPDDQFVKSGRTYVVTDVEYQGTTVMLTAGMRRRSTHGAAGNRIT